MPAANVITTDEWGIDDRYVDFENEVHLTSARTRAALVAGMTSGGDAASGATGPAGTYSDVIVVEASRPFSPPGRGRLTFEDGRSISVEPARTVALPVGYHELVLEPERGTAVSPRPVRLPVRLIVRPATCHLPDDLRTWGWAVQLYATRSQQSWGIGDLADLRRLGSWSRGLGAGVMMVNPLVAPTPVLPIERSPYFPSSRRFKNPLYLSIPAIPGSHHLDEELLRLATSGRALNQGRLIDRDAVFTIKMQALEICFARFGGSGELERYRAEQGRALEEFALFCALSELHGRDWRLWPEEVRRPDGPGIARHASRLAARIDFHAWVQWLLDIQLRDASTDVRLVQDLPIGLDAAGADAWCWQDLLAHDVSVGAPPDEFNQGGQDWGLTPFAPRRLRAAGYQPWIETIRATLRHARGLRIDHVMGLFRLFWIPAREGGPANGAYVRTNPDELLAIIAIESERARAFVVGEDLGTVEEGVRETLSDLRILSYRLTYFEEGAPATYPEMALCSVTTHDLPTVAGLWTGTDLTRAAAAGAAQNEQSLAAVRRKISSLAGVATGAPAVEVVAGVYRALGSAPCRVLLAPLDDALAVEERPNIPGIKGDSENWSLALPSPLEQWQAEALPRRIAAGLSRSREGD